LFYENDENNNDDCDVVVSVTIEIQDKNEMMSALQKISTGKSSHCLR
jgi:hypothetical protein